MNKKEFERLVRPYLKSHGQGGKINTEMILRDFKHSVLPTRISDMNTISELNKLIYIPNIWGEDDDSYLVFSDESTMYIYHPRVSDDWYETENSRGWSANHQWVMRKASITSMNNGRGWNVGYEADRLYHALEPDFLLKPIKYLNWANDEPWEVKE